MSFRPGTVSKILWHFTGGPQWDSKKNKQLKKLKPAVQGYDALKAILDSKELRVGNYQEIVKVIVPEKRSYNLETKKVEIRNNVPVTVKSKPVCCVADIPLQHLAYHSNRYGKIAIGFHRDSIVKAGFNPVLYTLEDTSLLNAIYQGYYSVDDVLTDEAESEVDSLQGQIDGLIEEHELDEYIDASDISSALSFIESGHSKIESSFETLMAYIKTFDTSEFDSIYCEREWRSTNNFKFKLEDIAMIIVPKKQGNTNFYKKFLKEMNLPRDLVVACWEDLIEH
ncbi:abortive infection system antitoxin AbiGi family protein [Shewanella chilikensis]|uniref:abortive infection system antitoxin AbiGi family protein n=1 Tax=Shewanella chilikensis TaxID=558541 RepID=UPI00200CB750|nr:abortive infection system antitoxin AbiGi family protein [Shewanella chilikensis]MCL1161593.1 abortive infection system antitoxin AbiGi family protein [Shewanella chilikensis]